MTEKIAMVAIIRDELPFLDEWLAYHRRMGIDRFFLYINEPEPAATLEFLEPHSNYVTPIEWYGRSDKLPGRNRQTKAYTHALLHHLKDYVWVSYLDVDEFLVFNRHPGIKEFLSGFGPDTSEISLCWRKFGHSGFFDPPPGLITSSLRRRQSHPDRQCQPDRECKSISRCSAISLVPSAHFVSLKRGCRVDADGYKWNRESPPRIVEKAYVHHYQCRSFTRWLQRADFGPVAEDMIGRPDNAWAYTREGCLREFVETVAVNFNECQDDTMLKHSEWLGADIAKIQATRTSTSREKT